MNPTTQQLSQIHQLSNNTNRNHYFVNFQAQNHLNQELQQNISSKTQQNQLKSHQNSQIQKSVNIQSQSQSFQDNLSHPEQKTQSNVSHQIRQQPSSILYKSNLSYSAISQGDTVSESSSQNTIQALCHNVTIEQGSNIQDQDQSNHYAEYYKQVLHQNPLTKQYPKQPILLQYYQKDINKIQISPIQLEPNPSEHNRIQINDKKLTRIQDRKLNYQKAQGQIVYSTKPLQPHQIHRIIFKIVSNTGRWMDILGITTQKWINHYFHGKQQDVLAYHTHRSRKGSLDNQLEEVISFADNQLGTINGGFIQMIVNLIKSQVTFTRIPIKQYKIQKVENTVKVKFTKNKDVYVFVRLRNVGDCVQIIDWRRLQNQRPPEIPNFQFSWDKSSHTSDNIKIRRDLNIYHVQSNISFQKPNNQKIQTKKIYTQGGYITSNEPLPKIGEHRVVLKIVQSISNKPISVGLLTKELKGKQFSGMQPQQIAYYSYKSTKGSLNIGQKQVVPEGYLSLGAPVGGHIEITLDFDNWKITFHRLAFKQRDIRTNQIKQTRQSIITAEIPQYFRTRQLYIFALLQFPLDELDVISQ